jgi:hypothetical protein
MPNPSHIVAEFRGKLRTIDGVPHIRIPALTPSHVVVGERMHVTAPGITARAELLHVNERWAPLDTPRLTHVSGDYIATVRVDLGTRPGYLAARDAKAAIVAPFYTTPYAERAETLTGMEERAHAAVLAAFAAHDSI